MDGVIKMLNYKGSVRKYFKKIILYFIMFAFALISLLSIFLYQNYRSYSLKIINRSNQEVLHQLSERMGDLNDLSRLFIKSVFNNQSTINLMYTQEEDQIEQLKNISAVTDLLVSHPFVHSIYIYNAKEDITYIVGDQIIVRKGTIYDEEIGSLINTHIGSSPIPRSIPFSEREKKKKINVYTYIMKDLKLPETGRYFSVVVNVYSDALFSSNLKQESADSNGEIFSVNAKGIVTGAERQEMFLNNLSDRPYINRIINEEVTAGYFISKDDETKKLITFTKSPISNWILINEVPYSYVISLLNPAKVVTSILIFTVLIIGFILAFVFSRSLYSPIDRLNRIIKKYGSNNINNSEKKINELDMLASHFQTMQYDIDELKGQKRHTLEYVKNGLLVNILENAVIDPKNIKEFFKECEINLSLESASIIVMFRIDEYQNKFVSQFSGDIQSLYKFALNNIALEIMSSKYPFCESVNLSGDSTAIVISLQKNDYDYHEIIMTLSECVRLIQKNYFNFIQISVSGFISSVAGNLYEISDAYNDVLELSKQRFLHGHGCILSSEKYSLLQGQDVLVDEELTNLLIEALKTQDYDEVMNIYNQIIKKVKNTNYDSFIFVINFIISVIVNTIKLIEKRTGTSLDIDFLSFNRSVFKCETLGEMDDIFKEMIREIIDGFENLKNNKSDNVVEKVNNYIEKYYMHEAICTADIADHVGLTQRYLNRVYRQSTSSSISDYLKEVRLRQAAKLLKETDSSVENILDKVGWSTKEYFYICFKKQYGVTPGEYRLVE